MMAMPGGLEVIVARILARSIAASGSVRSLHVSARVVVTVHLDRSYRTISVTVADTGQAIADVREVQTCFHSCAAGFCMLEGRTLRVQTTAHDEACIRTFALYMSPEGSLQVTGCLSLPKVCPKGPFSGSEMVFSVAIPEGVAAAEKALDILSLVQEVMEPLTMVAPPVAVQLRLKGYHEQDTMPDLNALPHKILYSLDVPEQATPAERLHAGLQAFFVPSPEASAEDEIAAEPPPSTAPVYIYISPCVTATGVPDPSRSATVWTACAGFVLIEEAAEAVLQPRHDLAVSLFQNYATLQRTPQPVLKVLERMDWASFGLAVQGISGEEVGVARLTFAPGSDETCRLMRALVIHLVPPVMPTGPAKCKRRVPGLCAPTQARLVKGAVTRALQAVKEARPLSLQSSFEQRMGCLADIARSTSALVAQSTNVAFQKSACTIAGTHIHSLRDVIHEALESIALASTPHSQAQGAAPGRGQQVQGIS